MAGPKERIGAQIKRLRGVIGFTQDALAARTGLSKSTIGLLERGLVWPQYENLEALAGALNVSVDRLLEEPAGSARHAPTPREALEVLIDLVERTESHDPERRRGYLAVDRMSAAELRIFLEENGLLEG